MSRLILGVDPGLNGAVVRATTEPSTGTLSDVAVWLLHQDYVLKSGKASSYDHAGIIRRMKEAVGVVPAADVLLVLEDVQGRAGWSASTAVSLAKCHGGYAWMAATLGWELLVVQARTWHKALGMPPSKSATAKQQAAQWVVARLPALDTRCGGRFKKPHDGVVDAACLAAYGAWWEHNRIFWEKPKGLPHMDELLIADLGLLAKAADDEIARHIAAAPPPLIKVQPRKRKARA